MSDRPMRWTRVTPCPTCQRLRQLSPSGTQNGKEAALSLDIFILELAMKHRELVVAVSPENGKVVEVYVPNEAGSVMEFDEVGSLILSIDEDGSVIVSTEEAGSDEAGSVITEEQDSN